MFAVDLNKNSKIKEQERIRMRLRNRLKRQKQKTFEGESASMQQLGERLETSMADTKQKFTNQNR